MQYPARHYQRISSYERLKMGSHVLDWNNEPSVYKEYPGRESFAIPLEVKVPPVSFFSLLQQPQKQELRPSFSFDILGQVLLLTQMLTGRARHANGEIWFRSVASAGALYPCELYVACVGIEGLAAGIYHYNVKKPALVLLRSGNHMPELYPEMPANFPALTLMTGLMKCWALILGVKAVWRWLRFFALIVRKKKGLNHWNRLKSCPAAVRWRPGKRCMLRSG